MVTHSQSKNTTVTCRVNTITKMNKGSKKKTGLRLKNIHNTHIDRNKSTHTQTVNRNRN